MKVYNGLKSREGMNQETLMGTGKKIRQPPCHNNHILLKEHGIEFLYISIPSLILDQYAPMLAISLGSAPLFADEIA